ncbi:MAG: phosphatase PAP2 family protein [Candidatus Cloacimonetes bacterium]|nr:phosphatase PAP2 family protein [Candidatus Cloacimonadota bacterium]
MNYLISNLKRALRPLDIISLTLIIYCIIILIIGWNIWVRPLYYLLGYLVIGIMILMLKMMKDKSRFVSFLRDWYPFFVFAFFFEASTHLNRLFFRDYLDPFFQQIDQLIFGYQPALVWGQLLDGYFWQELFHFGYFSFYVTIPGIAIYYYLKNRENFTRYVFVISFLFYCCYVIYIILPVIGGRFWETSLQLSTEYRYGIFTRIMAYIYNYTNHWGGAVPSSHVVASVGSTLYLLRNSRFSGYLLLPLSIILIISTVYCHYHYFIDALTGMVAAVILFYAGNNLYGVLKNV